MKKRRIRERVFAIVLVLCMVFTLMPSNTYLADDLAGTITDAGMDLATDATISSTDTITWPIEIYDYANDGMLFEFASIQGNGSNFDLLDDLGEYVYMPDMNTDYYVDYTKEEVVDSYVVKNWFPQWKNDAFQYTMGNASYPLKYYRMDEVLHDNGGTELIDFRDPNADGLLECYGATKDASGNYTFANVSGYIFKMNGENTAVNGDNTLVTDQSLYGSSNPNYAVSVLLRPTGVEENQYIVVAREENPGAGTHTVASVFKDVTVESTDIVMIAHSSGSGYGHDNWMDKVAAKALEAGDLVTKIVSGSDIYIKVNPVDGVDASQMKTVNKDKVKYAVLVYRTYDLEVDLELKLMLRAADGTKYFGSAKTIATVGDEVQSDWAYCVLDLSTFTVDTSTSTTTYTLADNWSIVDSDMQSAGIHLLETDATTDTTGYWFDVSHFAMFSSEGEATAYGEKALVNNNHYIYHYADEITYPNISETYGDICADYTQASIADSRVISYWLGQWSIENSTDYYTQTCDNAYGSRYYKFSQIPSDGLELIDFTNINGHLERDKAKYAVLCFKLQGLGTGGYANIRGFVRGDQGDKDFSPRVGNTMTWCGDGWQYAIFDITAAAESNYFSYDTDETTSEKIQSAGIAIYAYHGTATTDDDGNTTYSYALDTTYDLSVSHFAVFETSEEANEFVENVKNYHANYVAKTAYYNPIYHNIAYGFLNNSSTNTNLYPNKVTKPLGYGHYLESTWGVYTEESDGIYYIGHDGTNDISMEDYNFDGYDLFGTVTAGAMTAGLLETGLDKGNPVYREKVIDYLADLLYTTLGIPEYENGRFNYDFLRGKARAEYALEQGGEAVDLATAIRDRVGVDFEQNLLVPEKGNFADTTIKAQKGQLIGKWEDCKQYITTCYDAAYYLLNNLFVEGSYNMPQDTFNYLELNKTTTSDGVNAYIFDGGFTIDMGYNSYGYGVDYNIAEKIISFKKDINTGDVLADSKAIYYPTSTNPTTLCPFLPVKEADGSQIQTESPYFADDGVSYDGTYGATYSNRNYNYVMKSNAEFVYHEDDGLFFEFEGDDDVYLFINDQLVLDIGGCHGITKYRVDINEYVANARANIEAGSTDPRDVALALEEGGVYSFDFFYMERHGFGANCRILTNMRVTDPALHVEKEAYRGDEEINYGGIVVEDEKIEYNFTLENTGNTKLFNISFDDPFIGVTIDAEHGLRTYGFDDEGNRVYDTGSSKTVFGKNGETFSSLDADELTAVVIGYEQVTSGTGDYIRDNATLEMIAQENGDYICTVNEVKFETTTTTAEDGSTVVVTANEALKNFMATLEDGEGGLQEGGSDDVTTGGGGLWVNSTLTIKGIYYTLNDDQVDKGFFDNTVYATAETPNNEVIRGQDNHRVYVPSDPYYYQWADKDIIITKEKLVSDVIANSQDVSDPFYEKVSGLTATNITSIKEVSYTGRELSTSTVTIDTNNNVQVKYSDAGTHVFYLKVYYSYNSSEQSVMVPVVVYVTDVEDSYMVLDYGLSVDLTEDEIFKYDTVTIPGHETAEHIMGIAAGNSVPSYDSSANDTPGEHVLTFVKDEDNIIDAADGDFTLSGEKHAYTLTYKPDDFMDETDSIWAAVSVHETDGFDATALNTAINISKEVQMYKKISVLPANVVYYEDDFPAIKYEDAAGNKITAINKDGTSEGLKQSANQDQEYGQDEIYNKDAEKSGNCITKITIGASGQVAYFDFKGTGFELISRTNALDSAKFSVKVRELSYDEDGNAVVGTTNVKNIPVDSEFDHNGNGEGNEVIYQVPVIRVDDLEYGTYRVYISGVPARDYTKNSDGEYIDPNGDVTEDGKPYVVPTILYIDGLRIYQPLAETIESTTTDEETGESVTTTVVTPGKNEHYNDSENGAIFEEIRDLIVNGQAAVVTYDEEALTVSTGTVTWTENRNNTTHDGLEFTGNKVSSANDYLAFGPNNEVYMAKDTDTDSALVFYVKEQSGDVHNLQVAFREIDDKLFYGNESTGTTAEISYGVQVEGQLYWTEPISIDTATEQYYTIDYTKCPYDKNTGYYQVVIKVDNGMISYTNIKHNGLTIKNIGGQEAGEIPALIYVNGILTEKSSGEAVDDTIYPAFSDLGLQFIAKDTIGFEKINGEETTYDPLRYQTRNNKDLRLIAHVEDLALYSSVSFTLTIDDKPSKDLVCTTAYSGLYATDAEGNTTLYDTGDVYGTDYEGDYFVTYTINNYLLSKYAGKEVTITVTYTMEDGTTSTKSRTVTIGSVVTE